jgi:hypothetical protein
MIHLADLLGRARRSAHDLRELYLRGRPSWLRRPFPGSAGYWERRYRRGGSAGPGSQDRLAQFKADTLNRFVAEHEIQGVIEFGCGDGGQLALARYPHYIGLDVSATAIARCVERFAADSSKSFFRYDSLAFHDPQRLFRAELALSLDVIYHLIEDAIFAHYLTHLFAAAERYVIIYSSNRERAQTYHERSREFTRWIAQNIRGWQLQAEVRNPYPWDPNDAQRTSPADFFIYERSASA